MSLLMGLFLPFSVLPGSALTGCPGMTSCGSIIEHRRPDEATEFALDQFGQPERRAIFEPRTDDLHADRQSLGRQSERDRGRGQAGQRRDAGPRQLVGIDIVLAVDVDPALVLLRR